MRVVVVGLGVQGQKRLKIAGEDAVATVDPVAPSGGNRSIEDVDPGTYDAALVCTPDRPKPVIVRYLLSRGKHVLVEKPMLESRAGELAELIELAQTHSATCYTAYNHRFEPHIVNVRAILDSGRLGRVYLARFFYGNGTALDVRRSPWRDQGLGVLADIGSHLLDTALFLFDRPRALLELWGFDRFENRSCDRALFGTRGGNPVLEMEATLLSWRNTFALDLFGEHGSAHVHGLCKWGPSSLAVRTRVLPSGRPTEEVHTIEMPDPTWAAEYAHFQRLCGTGGTNLENDVWIDATLKALARQAGQGHEE
jgi:predicted dehydrogenase